MQHIVFGYQIDSIDGPHPLCLHSFDKYFCKVAAIIAVRDAFPLDTTFFCAASCRNSKYTTDGQNRH